MAKGQDKRAQGNKTKAKSSLKEKRAVKRAKKDGSGATDSFGKIDR